MKLFITGGTGFIGSHVVQNALEKGFDCIVQKRDANSAYRINIQNEPKSVVGCISKPENFDFSGIDVLVHLAAHSANAPYDNYENCIFWNVLQSMRLVDHAYNSGVKRFLITGSCFEYGTSANNYDFIPVDAQLLPTASYPASKAAFFTVFNAWAKQKPVYVKYLRLFQVFGEGEASERFFPSLKHAALSGKDFEMTQGDQIRDFINVRQVSSSIINELETSREWSPIFEVKNIGTGIGTTLFDFAQHWWQHLGATGQLIRGVRESRQGEVKRLVPLL